MNEEFLFYIWRYLKFDLKDLKTVLDNNLTIHKPGFLNQNGGPDFNNAQVTLDDTLWHGRIEIHVKSSDWDAHKHHGDYKYDNVILHVVYEANKPICRLDGSVIPTLELKGRIPRSYFDHYMNLLGQKKWIPCSGQLDEIPPEIISMWIERLFVERIESKVKEIEILWQKSNNNWEDTLHVAIARGFGLRINTQPFEMLAQALPIQLIRKSSFDPKIIEALVFGQSGLLNTEYKDDYIVALASEYDFQRRKHNLKPLKSEIWQWLRLRPASFPSVRLAQWSQFIGQSENLFSKLLNENDIKKIVKIFEVTASNYWDTHYILGKDSNYRQKKFSKTSIHIMIINVWTPILYFYGKEKQEQKYIDQSYDLLSQLKSENNKIMRKWRQEGIHSKSAFESQGLLQLYNNYCKKKKCLECRIGHEVLKK